MSEHEYPFQKGELGQAEQVFIRLVHGSDVARSAHGPENLAELPVFALWEHIRMSYMNVLGREVEGLYPLGSAVNLAFDVRKLDVLLHGPEVVRDWQPPEWE